MVLAAAHHAPIGFAPWRAGEERRVKRGELGSIAKLGLPDLHPGRRMGFASGARR